MQVTKLDEAFPFTGSDGRTGTHVSSVIKYIEERLGKVYEPTDEVGRLRMEMGFIWEKCLESAYMDHLGVRPGSVELDGIIGSPDGIAADGSVEEYKLTWSSTKTPVQERWRWMQQAMSYCKLCGTDTVIFRVFYVNGDYKKKEPEYQVVRIQFTQQEIDTCWTMMVNHARQMEREQSNQG